MSRYCVLADLRDYLGFSGTLGQTQDGLLQNAINRAEGAIDAYTRRTFVGTAGTAYYSRYFQDRVRNHALYIDQDLFSLTALQNGDGQTIPTGSVWLEPRNVGPPYRIIRLKSSYVWVWNTDSDITISGTWGYGTVAPQDIQQATVRLAAFFFRQKDVGPITDVAGFPEAGEVQIVSGIPNDVRYLLNPYRSRSGGAV